MRTTLEIDEDILEVAKDIAASRGTTAGKVISDLARKGLAASFQHPVRNGVPLMPRRPDGRVMTVVDVNRRRDGS